MASDGQASTQAQHSTQSSGFTTLDFPSSPISKTPCGQASTQLPHPVHLSLSTVIDTMIYKRELKPYKFFVSFISIKRFREITLQGLEI